MITLYLMQSKDLDKKELDSMWWKVGGGGRIELYFGSLKIWLLYGDVEPKTDKYEKRCPSYMYMNCLKYTTL